MSGPKKDYSDEDDVPSQVEGAIKSKTPGKNAPKNPSAGTKPQDPGGDPAKGSED